MTLTLTFDLLLKKLNLGFNFWTKRDRAFILQVCIPCGKTFLSVPKNLTFWPWLLTYFWKNLTLAIIFEPEEIRVSYYTCWFLLTRPFLSVPKNLTLWPWPWLLTYFWKNLTLALTFEPREIRLSYYRYVFLVARPFCPYQKFWPCDIDLDFWPTFEKT